MTICLLVVALSAASAQQPQPGAPAAPADITLTATSANVTEPGHPVRIRIFQWSTEEERTRLLAALNPPPPGARPGGAGERGRGDGRGAPARGRGRGRDAPAAPQTPAALLTAAIGTAPTIGYIWTDAVTGYSIKYAWRIALPGGGERLVLATDRRLGAHLPGWKPEGSTPLTDYEFTLIELRLDARGVGEGKTSLTTKVVADSEVRTLALDNYAAAPVILKNVKRMALETTKVTARHSRNQKCRAVTSDQRWHERDTNAPEVLCQENKVWRVSVTNDTKNTN